MSLTEPYTYRCGLTIPNRMAMAPLTNTQSHLDGTLGDQELKYLRARAEGGWGLMSTCAAWVSAQGHAWAGQLGVADDDHLPGLTRLATELGELGGRCIVQLHHGGLFAKVAPERISADAIPDKDVREATEADIEQAIADFTAAAVRSEAAGFVGVEIHGANGYLLTQFLAPGRNHRTDRWGGSLENRARLTREVVRSVRAATSDGFLVGIRLSPVDLWDRRGLVLAEGVQVAQWVAEDGVDFVHLSLGDAAGEPSHEPGAGVVATAVRDAVRDDVAVHAAGGIWTADDAKRARDAGVDVVVVGKGSMAHPDWPRRVLDPEFEPVRPTWSKQFLREAALGPAFIEYITAFPGMVEGGRPARG